MVGHLTGVTDPFEHGWRWRGLLTRGAGGAGASCWTRAEPPATITAEAAPTPSEERTSSKLAAD